MVVDGKREKSENPFRTMIRFFVIIITRQTHICARNYNMSTWKRMVFFKLFYPKRLITNGENVKSKLGSTLHQL